MDMLLLPIHIPSYHKKIFEIPFSCLKSDDRVTYTLNWHSTPYQGPLLVTWLSDSESLVRISQFNNIILLLWIMKPAMDYSFQLPIRLFRTCKATSCQQNQSVSMIYLYIYIYILCLRSVNALLLSGNTRLPALMLTQFYAIIWVNHAIRWHNPLNDIGMSYQS